MELMEKESGSGLSVLRTFRLLRILKLVRFMPALRRQLMIMLRTLDNVAVFFLLLVLFIFIFSILGMNLFGCKFCDTNNVDNSTQCDRKNFDSLLWALVTVFQVLTQEDWGIVLFNGMERTTHWAALYFVVLMTFGNYVLFNLLVAILVEGFSQEKTDVEGLENEETDGKKTIKDEKLIYFYGPKDNLEHEIQLLNNSPGMVTKVQSPSEHSHTNLTAALTQAKLVLSDSKPSSLKTNRHLSNSMKELYSAVDEKPIKAVGPGKGIEKSRRQSIRRWVAGAAHRKKYSATCKQLTGVQLATKNSAKMSGSSNVLPQFNLKNDLLPSASGCEENQPKEKKRRMSTFTDWKPSPSCQKLDKEFGEPQTFNRPSVHLDKLDEETEETEEAERITKLCSPELKKRSSAVAIHEMKSSPGTSLSGVFYCSSSVRSVLNQKTSSGMQSSSHLDNNNSNENTQVQSNKLQKKSPQNVESYDGKKQQTTDKKQPYPQPDVKLKRSPTNGDLVSNTASQSTLGETGEKVLLADDHSLKITDPSLNFNYATGQLSAITTQIIVKDEQRTTVPVEHFAIDVNQPISETLEQTSNSIQVGVGTVRSSRNSSYTGSSSMHRSSKSGQSSRNHSFNLDVPGNEQPIRLTDLQNDQPSTVYEHRKFCKYFHWYDWMTKRDNRSLFIFHPNNRLRLRCCQITEHKAFDYVVLIFISLNCITLAMERPKIPPWSTEREMLNAANYIFTFVFAVEMALKVIAKGLFYGKDAYFTSGWNCMDGLLVGVSLFDLILSIIAKRSPRILGILRVFRLLRSLRPLRVINRAPGLKLVVQTLLSSLRPIGNIVLICCTFFVIFGILGVQLFKGAFFYCEGPDVRDVRNKTDCLSDPRNHWINRKYNFDNLGQALMALFVLSSKDGWVNIMYTGLDAVGVDQQPQENFNEWRLLYFISFLLLVAFFVLNMFVGVVVENFHRCRQQQELEERARREAKRARKLEKRRKKMRKPPYYMYYSKTRQFIHRFVTGKHFDVAISGVIGLNVITMSLEHYQMPQELINTLKLFNFLFTSVFIVEAIFKVYALGLCRYFKDSWNQLDVLIVVLSVVGIILEEMEAKFLPINPTIIRVMRVARIARVLKLLKMAKGMRALLNTVMQALPQVGNLGLLFYLLFFIFAALGVELFGRLECDDDHHCQGLSEHAHFQNFGMAFLTLFRIATGDNWNGIMKDTLRDECDPSSDCLRNCCVSSIIAPLYFVVFVLLAQFVLVNVVVAVLMKHLEESHRNMEEEEDLEIDLEIARELAAEKKALEEAAGRREQRILLHYRFKMAKMNSLPPNFKFNFDKYQFDLRALAER